MDKSLLEMVFSVGAVTHIENKLLVLSSTLTISFAAKTQECIIMASLPTDLGRGGETLQNAETDL